MLKLRVQNIYIKPLLEPWNAKYKPWFETAYFKWKGQNMLKQKAAQNMTFLWATFFFKKITMSF